MKTCELIFENDVILITESKKRWPEKSARRALAISVEALIFLDLLLTFPSREK